jgi:hypothetical protein
MNLPTDPSDDLKRLNPHLYPDAHAHHQATNPQPQPHHRHRLVDSPQAPAGRVGRVSIRIRSHRIRPLDPDNAFPKHHIDALRHCGIIQDDTQDHITLEIMPDVKVRTKAEERTEMELEVI